MQCSPVFARISKAVETNLYHVYVLEGGSRSGKTHALIQFFILYAFQHTSKPQRVIISRKKSTWLNATVWVDFKNILMGMGLEEKKDYRKNETLHQIVIKTTSFEFVGLDDVQKLHGMTSNIVWINEAMEASKDDFDQLEQRTSDFCILDYNPSAETHWIYDNVCRRPDCYFDHSTMLQNPFVPENSRRKILSYEPTDENYANGTADERKWKIYGLGLRAKLEGLIFDHYEMIDEIPESVDARCYAADWGYANDPTAIVEVGYYKNTLYIDEHCYSTGLTSSAIIKIFHELLAKRRLACITESADPRLTDEIKQAGIPIFPVHKYAGSIEAGIDKMRELKIVITTRSIHIKHELDTYTYLQDKFGNWLNIPEDDNNHGLDAVRYVVLEKILGHNKKGVDLNRVANAIGR